MAWFQTKSCTSAEGADSASDGDLDIAYPLLLADKQWGSCGAIDYAAEAQQVRARSAAPPCAAAEPFTALRDCGCDTARLGGVRCGDAV